MDNPAQDASLSHLRDAVDRARAALPPAEIFAGNELPRLRQRLEDRLVRDLGPRLTGEVPALLVGIAGPNNVGKSSLFNSLAQARLSPARAEGGLTKQCLAAAHPSLWQTLGPLLQARYDVELLPEGAPAPVDQPGPPGKLHLVLSARFPEGLLLIDTPDFDSVHLRNRVNAEALLVTVDLVLFVVSRQSYQNAALIDFLKEVVGRGRPYAVVYNEAQSSKTAQAHLEKLALDVGRPPVATFIASHQPDVEEGRAFLRTEPLGASSALERLLREPLAVGALKALAMRASVGDAVGELRALADACEERTRPAVRLRDRIRHELRAAGERAALRGVPADVLVTAFRDELDHRSTVHRLIRTPFRALATALTLLGRQVRQSWTGEESISPYAVATDASEETTLKDGLRRAVESLAAELPSWVDGGGDAKTAELLREALGPTTLTALDAKLGFQAGTSDRELLYRFCRERVARELSGGLREGAMQAMTTLVYSVPVGAAAATTVATGGLGHDAVIWGGTLLSTPLLEKFVDMLGAGLRERVSQRWAEAHGQTLAAAVERRFFAKVMTRLEALTADGLARASALREAALTLAPAGGTR